MTEDKIEALQARLNQLERTNRRNRNLLLGGGVVLLLTAANSAVPRVEVCETVQCERLELLDRSGDVVGLFEVDQRSNEPVLKLENRHGHATLRVGKDGAGLATSRHGDGVSYLGVTEQGPYLNFRGSNLKNGIWTGVQPDGSAGFRAYGESLKVGVRLEVEPDGEPILQLSDKRGHPMQTLPLDDA